MSKRFKNGDKVRVLSDKDFSDKGKKLIGLEGVVVENPGNGHYSVALYIDGRKENAYLPTKDLEAVK